MNIRVVEILKAERVKNADRLLEIYREYGRRKGRFCRGIAKWYEKPED